MHSVRNYRSHVKHRPELSARVKGFIGQEAMHGREHRALNDRLAETGMPVELVDGLILRAGELLKRLPKPLQLATTAASEHFTAVLAEAILTDERTRELLFPEHDLRLLIEWHALEELEHKDVAFDLLDEVTDGNEVIRAAGLLLAATYFGVPIVSAIVASLIADRRHLTRSARRQWLRNYRVQRMLRPKMLVDILGYLRPGFHPGDMDTEDLVREWQVRLADSMRSPGRTPVAVG